MHRPTAFQWLLVLSIGVMMSLHFFRDAPAVYLEYGGQVHRNILDSTIGSPFTYRILSPFIADMIAGGSRDDVTLMLAYIVAHFIAFPSMFALYFAWFNRWLAPMASLAACCFIGATAFVLIPVWSPVTLMTAVEVILLCAALLLIPQRRAFVGLCALTVLSTLNRETAILIPMAYAAHHLPKMRREWWRAAVLVLLWAAVFVGLRLAIGARPDDTSIAVAWALNTGGGWWTQQAVFNNLPFLPIWIGVLLFFRRAPATLRRLMIVGLFYVALYLIFGVWREARLLLPLLVFAIPVAFQDRAARSQECHF